MPNPTPSNPQQEGQGTVTNDGMSPAGSAEQANK